jgi:hypothetical protein
MNAESSFSLTPRKRKLFFALLVILVLSLNADLFEVPAFLRQKSEVREIHQTCFTTKTLSSKITNSLNSFPEISNCTPEGAVKTKSTHPLSFLNFYKTRPRGLPGKSPVSRFPLPAPAVLLYPPHLSILNGSYSFVFYSLLRGNKFRIRPPPVAYWDFVSLA